MQRCYRVIFFLLILPFALHANTLKERARQASKLLHDYQIEQAFSLFTEIIEEVKHEESIPLNFIYWIHRERSFASKVLQDDRALLQDTFQMYYCLHELQVESDETDDYFRVLHENIDEALKIAEELAIDPIEFLKNMRRKPSVNFPVAGIIGQIQKGFGWMDDQVAKLSTKCNSAFSRVINHPDQLERELAEQRAKELYYPNLVHSQEEMETLLSSINEKEARFSEDLQEFFYKNKYDMEKIVYSLGLVGYTIASPTAANVAMALAMVRIQIIEAEKILEQGGGKELLGILKEIRKEYANLVNMDSSNKQASYHLCGINKIAPILRYDDQGVTTHHTRFCSYNVSNNKVRFSAGLGRSF